MIPNLTSLLRGNGERHGPGSRYGKTSPLVPRLVAPVQLPDLYWLTSQSTPPVTADTIDVSVNAGRLYRPQLSVPGSDGNLATLIPAQMLAVATAVKEDIVDGDSLWVKITWDPEFETPAATNHSGGRFRLIADSDVPIEDITTGTPDPDAVTDTEDGHTHGFDHTHQIAVNGGTGYTDTSYIGAQYHQAGITMASASLEIYDEAAAAALADDRDYTYIHIANFAVTDNVLTIEQLVAGCPLIVYPLIFVFGSGIGS